MHGAQLYHAQLLPVRWAHLLRAAKFGFDLLAHRLKRCLALGAIPLPRALTVEVVDDHEHASREVLMRVLAAAALGGCARLVVATHVRIEAAFEAAEVGWLDLREHTKEFLRERCLAEHFARDAARRECVEAREERRVPPRDDGLLGLCRRRVSRPR